jgi:methylmalonyl-CoA mutase
LFPRYRVVVIDAVEVHELGGSVLQELSWALVAGHHTLARCIEAGIPIDEASALVQFNFAVSSSYFAEIAKLRAFRWCWKHIVQSYAPIHACSVGTHVHASTSRYLQTAKDFNNNLLRATTQAMSAMIGGADSIDVVPHTSWQSTHDENALRLARNIHQLLLEESYFSTFRNAADGAFYIEQLTDQLVKEGWKRFQNLDSRFATDGAAPAGQWHREQVRLHEQQQQQRVSEGKRVVVGVNRYVNKADPIVVGDMVHTLSAPFEKE